MKNWLAVLLLLTVSVGWAQDLKTKNVVIITLDGFRWQELFQGPDERILNNPRYTDDSTIVNQFAGVHAGASREKLMPFFWNTIGTEGQLYGNRNQENKVDCS